MNIRHPVVAIAAALAFPIAGHAQESSATVTRAQVRADLVQLENAGYWPGRANDPRYPANIEAAEAKVRSQSGAGSIVDSSVGGMSDGSSASGSPVIAHAGSNSLYAHH